MDAGCADLLESAGSAVFVLPDEPGPLAALLAAGRKRLARKFGAGFAEEDAGPAAGLSARLLEQAVEEIVRRMPSQVDFRTAGQVIEEVSHGKAVH